MTTKDTSSRILVVIGAALAVLVVIATILALRPPATFDPGTPEGTTQGYFEAIDDGDLDRALEYLSDDLAQGCDVTEMRYWMRDVADRGFSVVIVSVDVEGDVAEVVVRVTEFYGAGPFGDSYEHDETLVMERSGDRWVIVETPWPLFPCEPGPGG